MRCSADLARFRGPLRSTFNAIKAAHGRTPRSTCSPPCRSPLLSKSAAFGCQERTCRIALTGVDQIGRIRANGGAVLTAIANMENDAVASSDDLHTQIAVLNKINGANVVGLRIGEANNQLQMHMLEDLLLQNKRARDAETAAMNARLFQWRYGADYGRTPVLADRRRARFVAATLIFGFDHGCTSHGQTPGLALNENILE